MPAKKYYVRKKIEEYFFQLLDIADADEKNGNWNLDRFRELLVLKFGSDAAEDFWQAKVANMKMGGAGRGRRRSPAQKKAIDQDKKNRLVAKAEKSERQKRNHRLIVLGAKLEEAAKAAGVDSFHLEKLTPEDWDSFFYDFLRSRDPNGQPIKIRKPSRLLCSMIRNRLRENIER